MTWREFNNMGEGEKENTLRGAAVEVATIFFHTRGMWKENTLYKMENFFFETSKTGTFDSKGQKVSEDCAFNPSAFALMHKPMEAWTHFMEFDIRILKAFMK